MEKLLLFQFTDSDAKKAKQIASNLKISCEIVDPARCSQPLEALVSGKTNPLAAPFTGTMPEESLMLICGLSDKRLDKLLFELRRAKVHVDYKAALTPTNQKWDFPHLLLEMRAERAAIASANPVKLF